MTELADSQMALMLSFYEGVWRKGPGSEKSTLKALSMLDGLPPEPQIADFGCGAGAASMALARGTQSSVTAVDIHQPFLRELERLAGREGLSDQITTVQADISDPPFPDASFDLIWSEGAIYNVGFQKGLTRWRRLLRAGGFVAVTEATWLCENPPQQAVDFWKSAYPGMTNIDDNLSKVRSAGFEPVGHFVLPIEDWRNYYGCLQQRLVVFRSEHGANAEAQAIADSVQQEIDLWMACQGSYGYVFYLGKIPSMQAEIREESVAWLDEHARISSVFKVESVLALTIDRHGLGGLRLSEHPLNEPYLKDYDALANCHPSQWAYQFDMANWGFFSAKVDGNAVGGAVVAWSSPSFDMLEDRTDLSLIWDVRVAPEMRRRGIAEQLFAAVERWARDRGCRRLKVETQNINVAACKFYASCGFELGAIHCFAYRELPHEVQLLWYKDL